MSSLMYSKTRAQRCFLCSESIWWNHFLFIILRVTSEFSYCKSKSLLSNINSAPRFEFFDKSFPECTMCVSGLHYSAGLGRIGSSLRDVVCTNPLALSFVCFNPCVNEWFKQRNSQDSVNCSGWTNAQLPGNSYRRKGKWLWLRLWCSPWFLSSSTV